MCGRFVLETTEEQLRNEFAVKLIKDVTNTARYNVSPTTQICIVLNDQDNTREARMMRWGLIPSWVKNLSDFKANTINARGETILEKKVFAPSFRKRRCIIVSSGFYEWKKITPTKKQKYFITPTRGDVLAFAGVWDRCTLSDGTVVESCTIITTEPNEIMEPIHDRMPMILSQDQYDKWLSLETTEPELMAMLKPCHPDSIEAYPVRNDVGRPRDDEKGNIERIADEELF